MKCLLCNRPIYWQVPLAKLFLFGPLTPPRICERCRAKFQHYTGPFCPGCGRSSGNGLCAECRRWQDQYGWVLHNRCLYHYNQAMKEFMHRYKFVGDYRLRAVFHAEMQSFIDHQQYDYLVPIPVTQETMATRGFNQTAGLIDGYDGHLLLTRAVQKGVPQSAKSREQRLQTPQPFKLQPDVRLDHRRILLVDDIYTTGRTLYHAATLLKAAGAASVSSLTLSG